MALSDSPDIVSSNKKEIRVDGFITYLPNLTTLDQADVQLAKLPALPLIDKGVSRANVRMALTDKYLAVLAHIEEPNMTQAANPWAGSDFEVYGATPGRASNVLGQVLLVPTVADKPGYGKHVENGDIVKRDDILLRTQVVDGGYELTALIPLELLTIDPDSDTLLMDMMASVSLPKGVRLTPHLFHTENSFATSAGYTLLHVEK